MFHVTHAHTHAYKHTSCELLSRLKHASKYTYEGSSFSFSKNTLCLFVVEFIRRDGKLFMIRLFYISIINIITITIVILLNRIPFFSVYLQFFPPFSVHFILDWIFKLCVCVCVFECGGGKSNKMYIKLIPKWLLQHHQCVCCVLISTSGWFSNT